MRRDEGEGRQETRIVGKGETEAGSNRERIAVLT